MPTSRPQSATCSAEETQSANFVKTKKIGSLQFFGSRAEAKDAAKIRAQSRPRGGSIGCDMELGQEAIFFCTPAGATFNAIVTSHSDFNCGHKYHITEEVVNPKTKSVVV